MIRKALFDVGTGFAFSAAVLLLLTLSAGAAEKNYTPIPKSRIAMTIERLGDGSIIAVDDSRCFGAGGTCHPQGCPGVCIPVSDQQGTKHCECR
jgi:hypothetical protein